MADRRRVIYYSDEMNDEFSSAVIKPRRIDGSYRYGGETPAWRAARLFWYRIVAFPVAAVFLKVRYGHRIVGRGVLRKWRGNPYFIFGNHTNAAADALVPSFVCFPNGTSVIVHPNNVSMPVLGRITPYLGALPLPDDMASARNFSRALEDRISRGEAVAIYPEAHIWPFYTKIRPFTEAPFRYPVQFGTPVFCFTNTYQKRRFTDFPRMVTYVDGPFFPNTELPPKERRKDLRDRVYRTMTERSLLSDVERIRYIKR